LVNILVLVLQQHAAIVAVIGGIVDGIAVWLEYRSDRRQQHNISVENRRLSEVNLKFDHEVNSVPQINEDRILKWRILWVSSRILTSGEGDLGSDHTFPRLRTGTGHASTVPTQPPSAAAGKRG
jgi:hypothetical protein